MVGITDEAGWLRRVLHNETVGGAIMLTAAAIGLVCANSGLSDWYASLTSAQFGIDALHLKLTTAQWAADLLLALFFLVAGAELKHELTSGSLSSARTAVVPIVGAIGGMLGAIAVYTTTTGLLGASLEIRSGWAIPSSTDIAFALAVLAIGGRGLNPSVRVLLLSIAVVNDVGSIIIIAIAFASGFDFARFALAMLCVAIWAYMQHQGIRFGLAYLPVFLFGWYFMHESGVHATIAGMAFGLTTTARARRNRAPGIEQVDRALRPWVAGLAVPIFAFLAAGVQVIGGNSASDANESSLAGALSSPLAIGIIAGLMVGQPLGVTLGTWAARRFLGGQTEAQPRELRVVAALAGVGFTVALLVSELTFAASSSLLDQAKVGILVASVGASIFSAIMMRAARR